MALDKLKITVLYDSTDEPVKPPPVEGKPDKLCGAHEHVADALLKRGHQVALLAAERKVKALSRQLEKDQSDVIFNLCESLGGENQHEQHVASILELLGRPFTGSSSLGITLARDKGLAKQLFQFHGIPYPKFSIMEAGKLIWSDELSFPLIVRPMCSDLALIKKERAVVRTVKELMERVSTIHLEKGLPVLLEEYIEGRELFVGVLGDERPETLPILEWAFRQSPRGQETKLEDEAEIPKTPDYFPTDIPTAVCKKIQQTAVTACNALHLTGYSRVDIRLKPPDDPQLPENEWQFYVMAINPNPALEKRSEFVVAARRFGLKYPQLLEHVIEQTLGAHRRRR